MIITCEACNTSFNLDDKILKPTGSKVRCSVCANVFTAFPQQAPIPEPSSGSVASGAASWQTESGPEPDLAAAAAMAAFKPDTSAAAEPVDAPTSETDGLEKDSGSLPSEDTGHDFGLDEEPIDRASPNEIEDAVSDALSEDLADIGVESTPEPDQGFASDSADESGATVIVSLDDDDLDLGPSLKGVDADETATVIASLDDDDLGLSLDGPPDVAETVIADLDQDNFDLDIPLETDGPSEASATVIASLDDDALPETMDDLNGLDLTLNIEPDGEAPRAKDAAPETDDASLDALSQDFDLEIEADDEVDRAPTADSGMAVDEDLDLTMMDLDDEGAGETAPESESLSLEDDLDLSSLEGMLKDDEEDEDDSVTMVVDGGVDPELTLDMDDDAPPAETDAAVGSEETLEDLEFDLDGDGRAETLGSQEFDDADQEIDLSEIEKMLEEPESGNAKFSSVPDQDLDLDIEASLETEKWMSESGEGDPVVMDEELDLSELEQVLDDVDTDAVDDAQEDPELDLDLGDGEALGAPTETVAVDNELDFDLSDFEDDAPPKAAAEMAERESVDMELDFEVEESGQAEQTLEDEGLEETVAIPEPKKAEKSEKAPPKSAGAATPAPKPKPVKKGISKSLVFLLIIAILGGGGYGTYYLLDQNGIDIPFVSDYLKPKVQDPGNLKLTTYDINSRFVDNANVGKLFVISGQVKNGYSENRGMITLNGQIFSTGKVPVNQEKVYCGNVMSDLELANLEWDKIKARLSNRLGDNRSNVKIEPGMSIPFMVVFSGLPEDLEEFTIEVSGSTSLK